MTLLAVPLDAGALNDRTATALLDGMLSVPAIFPTPGNTEERRILIASILSDPLNRAWLVWNGGQLIGCLILTHIIPKIDAQAHFVFFDRTLYGRKTLLWNLMGRVFQELELQRLTVEVPEYLTPLYKFARQKLMFRLEGEVMADPHPLAEKALESAREQICEWVRLRFKELRTKGGTTKRTRMDDWVLRRLLEEAVIPYVKDGAAWLTRLGSRRERACWNPETNTWTDMVRLRLLREEYERTTDVGKNDTQATTSALRTSAAMEREKS